MYYYCYPMTSLPAYVVKIGGDKKSTDYNAGSPQGTGLGPMLQLIYINYLEVESVNCIKYPDDTSFYRECYDDAETNLVGDLLTQSSWE